MPIVTLTSDLGLKDYYTAFLKGTILSACPNAQLIDISNQVQPFNILEGAFIVRNAYAKFPKGTIHIVCVNISVNESNRYILAEKDGHYFFGVDNGIFSLIFQDDPCNYYLLESPLLSGSMTEVFNRLAGNVVADLENKRTEQQIGKPIQNIKHLTSLQPVIADSIIRGTIFYIDGFQNAIVNITRKVFEVQQADRNYEIVFNRNIVTQLSDNYSDVPEGEKLCMFNSADFLEIAINKGKASSLLGLQIGGNILIDFV